MKYYLSTTVLLCLLFIQGMMAGGPWTQKKNEGIFIGNVSPVIYKTYSSNTGDRIDMRRRVSEVSTQGYFEMGLTDRLLLLGNLKLNYVGTSSKTYESEYFLSHNPPTTLLLPGKLFGMGNSSIGFKYRFTDSKLLFAMSIQVEFPASSAKSTEGLRTGYDAWTFLPGIHFGQGFPKGVYFFVEGAFGAHTTFGSNNNISHEYRLNGEVGYEFNKPLILSFAISVKESLKNDLRGDPSNYQQTGLYLNNQEFISWAFKFIYEINDNVGFTTALAGGFRTELIARTPVVSAGMYYKWKAKAFEVE